MATPYESARLILELYELRRDPKMRESRNYWIGFDPQSMDEMTAAMFGPDSALVRMAPSYWEMAASLVVNGAIDAKMFNEANGEHIIVFGKIEPLIPAMREMYNNPDAYKNLESVILGAPGGRERVDGTMKRIRAMVAARAAAAKA